MSSPTRGNHPDFTTQLFLKDLERESSSLDNPSKAQSLIIPILTALGTFFALVFLGVAKPIASALALAAGMAIYLLNNPDESNPKELTPFSIHEGKRGAGQQSDQKEEKRTYIPIPIPVPVPVRAPASSSSPVPISPRPSFSPVRQTQEPLGLSGPFFLVDQEPSLQPPMRHTPSTRGNHKGRGGSHANRGRSNRGSRGGAKAGDSLNRHVSRDRTDPPPTPPRPQASLYSTTNDSTLQTHRIATRALSENGTPSRSGSHASRGGNSLPRGGGHAGKGGSNPPRRGGHAGRGRS